MSLPFVIRSLGHHELPPELSRANEEDVEDVLLRAAEVLGHARSDVTIERVSSVIGGSCIACTDVVAYVGGTRRLMASPSFY